MSRPRSYSPIQTGITLLSTGVAYGCDEPWIRAAVAFLCGIALFMLCYYEGVRDGVWICREGK